MKRTAAFSTAAIALAMPLAAQAKLPEPVLKMIAAAEATKDPAQVAAVYAAAEAAYPDEIEALAKRKQTFDGLVEKRAEREALLAKEEIRHASLFDRWEGKGELGAIRATGNSDDLGLTAALGVERIGIDWRHKVTAQADYQRSDGDTTRERFLLAYEPNFNIAQSSFIFGLAQAERDRIQGYSSRYSVSGGLGHRVFDREDLGLEIKAGPAWRTTKVIEEVEPDVGRESYFAGLAAMNFRWQFAPTLKFTQNASAFVQSGNDTYTSLTGLEAAMGSGLSARLSYRVVHDTSPPDDSAKTDTLSRITLIYDF
ncbi:DUF481 domain-containing protein [Croceicoccus gelatinilyticus]|uniref:DUF481 domain-containing protein n=1 Tax=Croceicoccus gelatinilyticus TaxID=2835536 RepID=UPI001BCC34F3|nr:DUF481 domain-containing protein [Croceicoccus gelatinilyticus]MBS7671014.1 DUF481 domain-containing protein [Croceicoccus gelatinilyticus]